MGLVPRWLFKRPTKGNTWWECEVLCWVLMWRIGQPWLKDAERLRVWRNKEWGHDLPKWMKRAGSWIKAWRR